MASTSKGFKKCVDPCPHYLTPNDTNNLCVFCLKKEHARDVLEGKICVHCQPFFYEKAPLSSVPLFEERVAAVCFPRFGTHCCRGTEANEIAGSQLDLADELERDHPFSRRHPRMRVSCWIVMTIFRTSSDSAASAGLCPRRKEMFEGKGVETEPYQSSCTAYDELLEVMDHKIIFLAINPQLERAFISS